MGAKFIKMDRTCSAGSAMQAGGGGKLKPLANIVGKTFKTFVMINAIAELPGLRESDRAFIAAPLTDDGTT